VTDSHLLSRFTPWTRRSSGGWSGGSGDERVRAMSAPPSTTDIRECGRHVRKVPNKRHQPEMKEAAYFVRGSFSFREFFKNST
jgi:hypothetical protein